MKRSAITRRNFIKLSGYSGAALALGYSMATSATAGKVININEVNSSSVALNAWISIDTSGKVTLVYHRAEMGQGSYQSVPQIIAEELEVNIDQVNIVSPTGIQRRYKSLLTIYDGSVTIRGSYQQLLELSATSREMLISAAAKKWNVPVATCYAEEGKVIHKPTGNQYHYGELVEEASHLTPPVAVPLKKIKDYKVVRKPLPRKDTPLKVNGAAIFGLDKKLPGMHYAVVERSPRYAGKVKSFDDTETRKVPGVTHVFKTGRIVLGHEQEGVAVVATNSWAAIQGRKLLRIVWDDTDFEKYSSEQLYTQMHEDAKRETINLPAAEKFEQLYRQASMQAEAIYETPYQSHCCMEPVNCIADVKEDSCTIWGPIQDVLWIQEDISARLNLPVEKVEVNMTFLGGGFGRKASPDYPHEAVIISQHIKAPVQVIWTREDDMRTGPYRPGAVYRCRAVLNELGKIQAFDSRRAGQNLGWEVKPPTTISPQRDILEGLWQPLIEAIPQVSSAIIPLHAPIPVMWWRSISLSTNVFAYESFLDELAIKAAVDPFDFRRRHVTTPRYTALMDKLEEFSGWRGKKKHDGWGVAFTEGYWSIVGEVVKVSKKGNGSIAIDKVFVVIDCGWYVNPDIIRAQVEGSVVMALGAAVKHAIHFEDGKVAETNLDKYTLPRLTDTPPIEVYIMNNEEKAGGVGEPALPPFAPALTNAVADLTGVRVRTLPFDLGSVNS
ncbi:MAG TPA: molybdopterin cofactor-binding domain-containing protein [Ohtaekwangia sp.]|uniref:xanthine dehydrogenase family protein molybdopterin-binding subunit n=1 Tax=Ohtaekwangia sp. TaxID=2066019 RepID=UPI002F9466A2